MRFGLSTSVLLGFVAGIAAGLFGGEYCAPLQIVGDVYIGLLQMTVLPYMRVTMSLLVPDFRRREFSSLESIQRMTHLRVATMPSRRFHEQLTRLCPQLEIVSIQSPREFFVNPALKADAMLISAEAGSAWTLVYPGFTPVVPQPRPISVPLAYPIAAHDNAFADFVSQWIELKSASPEFRQLYDYWILGRGTERKPPRWSVLRDVLGWVP